MRLKTVHIKEFQSIWDSNPFHIGEISCLVGKNEAGKTAILQALYRLNPIIAADGNFDVVDDYPRSEVDDYRLEVEATRRKPADVVTATFELEQDEINLVEEKFGPNVLKQNTVTLRKGYTNERTVDCLGDYSRALTHVIKKSSIPQATITELLRDVSGEHIEATLAGVEQTADIEALRSLVAEIDNYEDIGTYIYNSILDQFLPKFLYFDEYYQMKGCDNIEALMRRVESNALEKHDYPLLGLIAHAQLDLNELLNPMRTRTLKNKLEAAGNRLTRKIVSYWSQNQHLKLKFDVRPAQPEDPEGMRSGTNIWGDVEDTVHAVTTEIGSRSKGFVWFFSFLSWYEQLHKEDGPLILLLDEPGLSLHGRAQEDLLRYFDSEILGQNQLIFTTHSPFMVDPKKFDRVRIVQDKSIETSEELAADKRGTKVLTEVLEANEDSLFPLQGALGYEVHQTLFIGPNNLIVEGVSDLLYLQTISGVLDRTGRVALDEHWTITPVGGSDNVPTFVALVGAKTDLNIATLIDMQKKNKQAIENLYKRKLLNQKNVFTFSDFTGSRESDIEDMFEVGFYVELVNAEYSSVLPKNITVSALPNFGDRILPRVQGFFTEEPLKDDARFNHYRPARYFSENIATLEPRISDSTLTMFEEAFKALNKLV